MRTELTALSLIMVERCVPYQLATSHFSHFIIHKSLIMVMVFSWKQFERCVQLATSRGYGVPARYNKQFSPEALRNNDGDQIHKLYWSDLTV